jgi:tetratricopeptide (TPR) repeat protein
VAGHDSHVLRKSPLPAALARELDLLCDDFERRLRQGERPCLEDYLHRVPAEAADSLRSELLTVEREWRCQATASLPSAEQPGDSSPGPDAGGLNDLATVRPEQGKSTGGKEASAAGSSELPTVRPQQADVHRAGAEQPGDRPPGPDAGGLKDPPTVRPEQGKSREGKEASAAGCSEPSTFRPEQTDLYRAPVAEPHDSPPVSGRGKGAQAGERFGDYELLEEIAHGGMGAVYKARQVSLGRLVALKLILAGRLADDEDVRRFRREAEAAAQLDHPGIVPVYEVGEHNGQHFFSMGLVEGESLAHRMARGPLPAREAAALVQAVAEAMAYAHARGVIHRDLKPGNILVDREGRPRVTDFGIAKRMTEDSGQTRAGEVMGTPSYMPPEQAVGSKDLGPAADVYALGAVLYALLDGRPPFHAATVQETLRQVVDQEPVPPHRLNPSVPRDLETICLKCLEKDPRRRYASAAELADDLRRYLAEEPIRARPVSRWERALKWARRRPAQAGLLVAVFLAVLGGVAGAVFYGLYKDQQAKVSQQEAKVAQQEAERKQQELDRQQEQQQRRRKLDDLGHAAEQAETAGKFAVAKEHWDQALALVNADPDHALEDRRHDIQQHRDRVRQQLKAEQARQQLAAKRQQWRDKQERFRKLSEEVLTRAIPVAFRDRPADVAAIRQAAAKGLKEFGLSAASRPEDAARALEPARRLFPGDPGVELATSCYRALLVWAEAEATPLPEQRAGDHQAALRQALHLLDLAAALGQAEHLPTPSTFHLRRARYLDRLGNQAAAAAARRQADRLEPHTPLDLLLSALDSYYQDQLPPAAAACAKVLQQQPDHFWAQYLLALCDLRARQWAKAEVRLTACLGRRPDFFWARLLRASAVVELGQDFEAAVADFSLALQQATDPRDRWAVLVNRGAMWIKRQRWDEAVADLQQATRLEETAYQGYVNLAWAYQRRKDWGPAVAALDTAIRLRPEDPALYHTRARVHLLRNDSVNARRDFEQAIKHAARGGNSERLASDLVELGHVQHQAKEHAAALASCDAALRALPNYSYAYRQRAETLIALERYTEASQALDRFLKTQSRPPAVYHRARGLIHARLGQYPQALQAYSEALALERRADTLCNRGRVYLAVPAAPLALADFEAALRLAPGDGEALCGRALARVLLGQVREALADVEAALKQARPTPTLLFDAACVYARAAQHDESVNPRDVPRYQERAVALLRAALEALPPADRAAFWRRRVQAEPALLALRQTASMRRLAQDYGR